MNICIVSTEIGPSNEGSFIGGTVNNVVNIAKGLAARGNRIFLVTTPARFSEKTNFNVPWADVRSLQIKGLYPSLKYGLEFAIKATREIKELHKEVGLHLIHGHSGFPAIGVIPSALRQILHVPSIHSLYCPIGNRRVDSFSFQLMQFPPVVKNLFLSVDRILALSRNIEASLRKISIPQSKISVIPPAIDTGSFNPNVSGADIRNSLGIKPDERLILFVGNLSKTKGIEILIHALRKLKIDFPNIRMLATLHVSKRQLANKVATLNQKIQRMNLNKNVSFMGITSNMPAVIAACDVFVAPFISTFGPSDYPLPLLEAMASAKPVIATNVGGIPELIKDGQNGVLINPGSPNELSNALLQIFENENEANRMAKNGYNFVRKNFSIERITDTLERLYKEIIRFDYQ